MTGDIDGHSASEQHKQPGLNRARAEAVDPAPL